MFTAGIDDTLIVKSYRVYFSHGVVLGFSYHNHYLSIDKVKDDGLKLFFRNLYMDYMGNLRQRLRFAISHSRILCEGRACTSSLLITLKP